MNYDVKRKMAHAGGLLDMQNGIESLIHMYVTNWQKNTSRGPRNNYNKSPDAGLNETDKTESKATKGKSRLTVRINKEIVPNLIHSTASVFFPSAGFDGYFHR